MIVDVVVEKPWLDLKVIRDLGGACPTQFEGFTTDGRDVYVRFRHGTLTVHVARPGEHHKFAALDDDADVWFDSDDHPNLHSVGQPLSGLDGDIEWREVEQIARVRVLFTVTHD